MALKMKPKHDLQTELLMLAAQVRERAYAPYSNYKVGAAVLGKSGKTYLGCNVENASYGLTVCAERNAIFKGISEGEKEFTAIAVVTPNGGSPCGACRQVEFEFMQPNARVFLGDEDLKNVHSLTLGEGQRKDALKESAAPPRKKGHPRKKNQLTTKV
jgi:cytidine deaminase